MRLEDDLEGACAVQQHADTPLDLPVTFKKLEKVSCSYPTRQAREA